MSNYFIALFLQVPPANYDQSQPLTINQVCLAAMEWASLRPVWQPTEGMMQICLAQEHNKYVLLWY